MIGSAPLTIGNELKAPVHAWWLCSDEVSRQRTVDNLCAAGWRSGKRVAVVSSPETVLSHVSALENILLPAAWLDPRQRSLRPQVRAWLEARLGVNAVIQLLQRRGDELDSQELEHVGIARAMQLKAGVVLIGHDDRLRQGWLEESVELLEQLLPEAELDVVSARTPPFFRPWVVMRAPHELAVQ